MQGRMLNSLLGGAHFVDSLFLADGARWHAKR